eukprot:7423429-Lingulodinium_polyedra.AAC.1
MGLLRSATLGRRPRLCSLRVPRGCTGGGVGPPQGTAAPPWGRIFPMSAWDDPAARAVSASCEAVRAAA